MDWEVAIHYAKLVQAAEDVSPNQLCDSCLTVPLRGAPVRYDVLVNIFANDLATDSYKARRELIVSIGYVAQDEAGNVVIAIRGTRGIHEWLNDLHYHAVSCPFLPDAGCTEDGFTEVYMSLRVDAEHGAKRLRQSVADLVFPLPVKSLTLCGHSLGAALATLLALDLAVNTEFKDLTLYNFASPRTGDERFAQVFNRLVPNTYRVVNPMDLVTEVPRTLLSRHTKYQHVESTTVLVPHHGVKQHLLCMHHLSTYAHLMAKEAGLNLQEYPLRDECCRNSENGWLEILKRRARHTSAAQEKTEASLHD